MLYNGIRYEGQSKRSLSTALRGFSGHAARKVPSMSNFSTAPLTVGSYALAHNLVGFYNGSVPATTLRVKVVEVRAGYVWVRTADLADSGTPLTLNASQCEPFEEYVTAGVTHATGLVTLA